MRKRATDLLREADEIRKKANELRKLEKKRERTEGRLRTALLGALFEQRLANDAAERSRVTIELRGFLKSPEHRELFQIDAPSTYIDELPEQHAARRAKRDERKAARALTGRDETQERSALSKDGADSGANVSAATGRLASASDSARAVDGEAARVGMRGDGKPPSNGADASRATSAKQDAAGVRASTTSSSVRAVDAVPQAQAAGGVS